MFPPHKALEKLIEGNKRFVNEEARSPRQSSECRKRQISDQNPFCAVLTCSDSRVPVEILFDQGIGDIFVVRLAGNVASDTAMESLDFAVHVLNVSLIVIMGHQNCGAVNAVINHLADQDLGKIASRIFPAVKEKKSLKEGVIANVEAQVETARSHLLLQPDLKNGRLQICGAYYDFETGLVSFL
jgi:carbonic anhydrase